MLRTSRATLALLLTLLLAAGCPGEGPAGQTDDDGDGFFAEVDDCDDGDPTIHPGADEYCDNVDQDCDGDYEDAPELTWYEDLDGDGYGSDYSSRLDCRPQGDGWVLEGGDCADWDPTTSPGAPELCDYYDNNCNGETDEGISKEEWFLDVDGDGWGTRFLEYYGRSYEYVASCDHGDDWVSNEGDCDDRNPAVHPRATEVCDGVDNDCNGLADIEEITCSPDVVVIDGRSALPALFGTNGLRVDGAESNRLGATIAGAGDVNGDGFEDLLVGTVGATYSYYGYDTERDAAAYLVFGSAETDRAVIDGAALDGDGVSILVADEYYSRPFVVPAGDVNGDGFADLAMTDRYASGDERLWVFFGGDDLPAELAGEDTDGSRGFSVTMAAGYGADLALAAGEDLDGDGFADLAWVGVRGNTEPEGAIVWGHAGPWPASLDAAALSGEEGVPIEGVAEGGSYETLWLSSAGDFDGDGDADLALGRGGGDASVWLLDGGPDAGAVDVSVDAGTMARVDGMSAEPWFALGDPVGDLNGDGFDDLLVNASDSYSPSLAARAWVVFGTAEPPAEILVTDAEHASVVFGLADDSAATLRGTPVGDIDGDGLPEAVVEAGDGWGGRWDVAIVHGAEVWPAAVDLTVAAPGAVTRVASPSFSGGWYGAVIRHAGDVDGDGIDDLIIGDPDFDESGGLRVQLHDQWPRAAGVRCRGRTRARHQPGRARRQRRHPLRGGAGGRLGGLAGPRRLRPGRRRRAGDRGRRPRQQLLRRRGGVRGVRRRAALTLM